MGINWAKQRHMIESGLFIFGAVVIILFFIKNTITHGRVYAASESRSHLGLLKIVMKTFVEVFFWGKQEKEIIDD